MSSTGDRNDSGVIFGYFIVLEGFRHWTTVKSSHELIGTKIQKFIEDIARSEQVCPSKFHGSRVLVFNRSQETAAEYEVTVCKMVTIDIGAKVVPNRAT